MPQGLHQFAQHSRAHHCGGGSSVASVPSQVASEVAPSSTVAVSEVIASSTSVASEVIAAPTTTVSESVASPTTTSKTASSSKAVSSSKTSVASEIVSTSATSATPATTSSVVSSVVSSAATAASTAGTVVAAEALTNSYCGEPNAYEILSGTPWIVYSMNYNYASISGSCCTGYYSTTGSEDDSQAVHWSSIWDIDETVGTDVVKGYSFIGLTQNLETTLDSISAIPSTYTWSISNTTAYKGNVVYDFMTSDTKGDSTSSAAQELMLWLQWEGGQVPIGWADGAVATVDGLFGKDGWQLYQGKNTDTGITVSSLLAPADSMFDGTFDGDIKDWLVAMSEQGIFSTSTYVNVGNAGMEPYWGTVTFDNNLSLRIDL
ncbi:concanavalin A-like lectin/glucanase domain-containing protein [Pestalotiopsis sp. NC0098]|nr:concanavalin A-like lectin/glucanase domain-containing protein [Pestalotiopsis sp. NC0098]